MIKKVKKPTYLKKIFVNISNKGLAYRICKGLLQVKSKKKNNPNYIIGKEFN